MDIPAYIYNMRVPIYMYVYSYLSCRQACKKRTALQGPQWPTPGTLLGRWHRSGISKIGSSARGFSRLMVINVGMMMMRWFLIDDKMV